VPREQLPLGATLSGPAVIVEATSTTYLDAGFAAAAHASGALIITRESA